MWPQLNISYALVECAIDQCSTYASGLLCFRTDAPAGTDVKVLLQKCLHSILGSALPYKETGDAEERALANTVTAGGLLLKHLTGKLQNAPWPLTCDTLCTADTCFCLVMPACGPQCERQTQLNYRLIHINGTSPNF